MRQDLLANARRLTSKKRTEFANRHLARYLAFVAGAANAGGLLAVHQYTSHMSGIVSAIADNVATGSLTLALDRLAAVTSFLAGAFAPLLIRWGNRRKLYSQYALPLLVEGLLLLIFGTTFTASVDAKSPMHSSIREVYFLQADI